MPTKTFPFDISEHLETDEDIRGFLKELANSGGTADIIHALEIATRASGMIEIAVFTPDNQEKAAVQLQQSLNH
ncbi:MAG: hypothetical protein WAM60_15940 [Candidatus Promineifilaceae bacterium]